MRPDGVTPGGRTSAEAAAGTPSIPFECEPFTFFHPLLAGLAVPGTVQPVGGRPLLEEEPATWPELSW
jgi:hypothetical protein